MKLSKKEQELNKLYKRDHAAYFKQVLEGKVEADDDPPTYAGYRAWLDGYNAALRAAQNRERSGC